MKGTYTIFGVIGLMAVVCNIVDLIAFERGVLYLLACIVVLLAMIGYEFTQE